MFKFYYADLSQLRVRLLENIGSLNLEAKEGLIHVKQLFLL